jgi:hypothetical protein
VIPFFYQQKRIKEMKLVHVGKGKQIHIAKEGYDKLITLCGAEKCSTGNRRHSNVKVEYYAKEPTCSKCIEISKE